MTTSRGAAWFRGRDVDDTYSEVNRESLIRTRLLVTRRRERSSIDHWRGQFLGEEGRRDPLLFTVFLFLLSRISLCESLSNISIQETLLEFFLDNLDRPWRTRSLAWPGDGRDRHVTNVAFEVSCVSFFDQSSYERRMTGETVTTRADNGGAHDWQRRRRSIGSVSLAVQRNWLTIINYNETSC